MCEYNSKEKNFRDVLQRCSVNCSQMLQWHFTNTLKQIYKRISLRHTCRNAWSIEVKVVVHRDIFVALYAGLENFRAKLGFSISESWYKTKKELKSVTFSFTLLGILVYHLDNICNQCVDIPTHLHKDFKCGSLGEIVASTDKPVTMTYNYANETLRLNLHYFIKNEFGIMLSY